MLQITGTLFVYGSSRIGTTEAPSVQRGQEGKTLAVLITVHFVYL